MNKLVINGRTFSSRLFVGTGKYPSPDILAKSLDASGTDLVTVALRRVNLSEPDPTMAAIDFDKYLVVPNTSGAKDAEEAVRLARLARSASGLTWLKLEVTPDPVYLLPDPAETLKAAEILIKEGFT
ncbi:MAG: thiazole synthase, partial [Deltaproteobacteria bacterium]|nr:thiazole synthase [Deltaproteobacteria bacterium]